MPHLIDSTAQSRQTFLYLPKVENIAGYGYRNEVHSNHMSHHTEGCAPAALTLPSLTLRQSTEH